MWMATPLCVVRVIARLNIGGPARHVAVLDGGLRARGYRTLLLHGEPESAEGSLAHLVTDQNLPVSRVATLRRRVSPWNDLKAFYAVARTIFETRPDIVHKHTAKAGALGRLAAILYNATRSRSQRCLVVHTYHGTVFHGYFGWLASLCLRIVERTIGYGTDRIAVVSDQQRHELVEALRVVPATKVTVIPLGLDLEPFLAVDESSPTLRTGLGLTDGVLVLGFVGRFVPIKDLATLIRAFSLVKNDVPDATLLLAGDGPLRSQMDTLVTSLGVANAVRFLGWRHDLPALYCTLDIVLLSSLNEGTPVSVIEGMAAGRVVVATDVGGVRDVIEHGRTGLLVPPRQPQALAEAIGSLARDAGARNRMGRNGRQAAVARFRASRLIDDVDRVYRAGLAAKRREASPESVQRR